jgi:glycosyltransferase involved in cell wall biosynthesis
MVPFVDPFLERRRIRPELHLDLDDIESATHRRLAELRRANGDHAKALIEDAQARQSEAAEAAAFRKFDLVYVCSETDRARLAARTNVEICVLPNAVRIPGAGQHTGEEGTFRFLFVGTLGYYANEDAALQLCQEIVPRLRQASPCDFAVDIVGGGASDRIREAARAARVNLLGWVQDIETYYRGAHAMVVPLRAGGGTRIKILEAFGYRLPVVSTSSGSEGIDARDEQEILLADTPEAFVHACARLMGDPELRKCLTMNAFNLVLRSYSLDGTRGIIGAVRGRRGRHSCSAVT